MTPAPSPRAKMNPALKFALELGPLALFFLTYSRLNIFAATGVMMAAVFVTLAISYSMLRRIPIMPLVTAAIVAVFGSLTLIFQNEMLIKIKPTALYLLFSGALFFGLAFKKPILQIMFDGALNLNAEGWRILTWRWAFFFLFEAAVNEAVWRMVTTAHWVAFKSFGFIPMTIVFALLQAPLIMKHEATPAAEREEAL